MTGMAHGPQDKRRHLGTRDRRIQTVGERGRLAAHSDAVVEHRFDMGTSVVIVRHVYEVTGVSSTVAIAVCLAGVGRGGTVVRPVHHTVAVPIAGARHHLAGGEL